jgi:hypothetical protein
VATVDVRNIRGAWAVRRLALASMLSGTGGSIAAIALSYAIWQHTHSTF